MKQATVVRFMLRNAYTAYKVHVEVFKSVDTRPTESQDGTIIKLICVRMLCSCYQWRGCFEISESKEKLKIEEICSSVT